MRDQVSDDVGERRAGPADGSRDDRLAIAVQIHIVAQDMRKHAGRRRNASDSASRIGMPNATFCRA